MKFVDQFGNPAFFWNTRYISDNRPGLHVAGFGPNDNLDEIGVRFRPYCTKSKIIGQYDCSMKTNKTGNYTLGSKYFE